MPSTPSRAGERARTRRASDWTALGSSFRDPSGFVFRREDTLFRQVNESFREDYDAFIATGLYERLVAEHLLVPHEELHPAEAPEPGAYKLLKPETVGFISYPYEWCPGQLHDAALVTLRVQELALDHGMSLRDASAYNVQFHRGRPTLIDTLSFERLSEGRPWVAYRQFCQHFLAPLALAALVDPRLTQLARVHIDGIPLDLASALLPGGTKLRPGLLAHIHAHAKAQKKYEGAGAPTADTGRTPNFSMQAFRGLLDSLAGTVRKLRWEPGASTWAGYYETGASYSADALADKERIVASMLDAVAPSTVWDLGANTGRFSRLAADRGAATIAFDFDVAAVERNWREVREKREESVLPLVLDLTNPSPAIGWANGERMTIAERGPVDLVLALALVHHLAIGNNVPLDRVADFLASVGRAAIVEFVPKDDDMVRRLLATRDDVFPGYTRDGFEAAMTQRFTVERAEPVGGSSRVVYLLRRLG